MTNSVPVAHIEIFHSLLADPKALPQFFCQLYVWLLNNHSQMHVYQWSSVGGCVGGDTG